MMKEERKVIRKMTFVYVGVFIVAVAFALVAIYIAKILSRISTMMGTLRGAMQVVETRVDSTIAELEETIGAADVTASDVETKLAAMDGLFLTVRDIGETSAIVGEAVHSHTKQFSDEKSLTGMKPFIRAMLVSEFGHGLFRSWKRGQQASS